MIKHQPDGMIIFDPSNWRERIFRRITDYRITQWATVEKVGRHCNKTFILVIRYGFGERAVFIFGRRLWK